MSKPPVGMLPGIQCPRRSNRKTTTFPIWLRSEELGPIWEEETETQTVSRCGAGLRCRHLVSAESMVVIVRQDTGRRAKARVRYFRREGNVGRDAHRQTSSGGAAQGRERRSEAPSRRR